MSRAQTLYDKIWESHKIAANDGVALLYIDRHLVHEVTSPQAFEGLSLAGRDLWRAGSILAVPDHNVPTKNRAVVADPISRLQIETLDSNCEKFGVREIPMNDSRQGIVHIIGPEQGLTLPGLTVVCGDSHTSTHGAFGCLAFGIGTTEIEHVMATQCLALKKIALDANHRRRQTAPRRRREGCDLAISAKSAPPARAAMSSNTRARPCARCR